MGADKRLDTLQEEMKLLKGELKQSLASVRDYLLNLEMPSSEISTILAALNGEGQQTVTMKGSLATPSKNERTETRDEEEDSTDSTEEEAVEDGVDSPPEDEQLLEMENPQGEGEETTESELAPEDAPVDTEETSEAMPEETMESPEETIEEEEPAETETPEPELLNEEEQPMEYEKTAEDVNMSVPRVNMLANLINWVARANREIGREQIPTFLEVYGISGHLSPELKDVIIHLSEITTAESDAVSSNDIWSESMLLLHGILTGGDAPLHPIIPSWKDEDLKKAAEEEIIEVDKGNDRPVKLKLVFPNGEGKDQEYCIDLMPQAEGENGNGNG